MNKVSMAVVATMMVLSGPVLAQQQPPAASPPPPDFSKVEIKTSDLGDNVYMLEGQGGNITVAVAKNGIIMVDGEFAPLHDKIKAAIEAISKQPIKYLVNTHFHGDHTGGNEPFAKDGVTVISEINVRNKLAAGTTNGLTGVKTPPAPQGALPSKTYTGAFKIRLSGRVADLEHIANAHTDGDTYIWFKTANVLSTGDTFTNGRYPNIDFANGGNIKGMIAATDVYLKLTNAKSQNRSRPRAARRQGGADGIPDDADHRARPHDKTGQGGQERGRRHCGKAVFGSRCKMGAHRACQQEFYSRRLSLARRQAQ
jgi:cyclase